MNQADLRARSPWSRYSNYQEVEIGPMMIIGLLCLCRSLVPVSVGSGSPIQAASPKRTLISPIC